MRLAVIIPDQSEVTLCLPQSPLLEEEAVRLWLPPFLATVEVVVVKAMEQAPVLEPLVKVLLAVEALQAHQTTPVAVVVVQEVRVKHQTIQM